MRHSQVFRSTYMHTYIHACIHTTDQVRRTLRETLASFQIDVEGEKDDEIWGDGAEQVTEDEYGPTALIRVRILAPYI